MDDEKWFFSMIAGLLILVMLCVLTRHALDCQLAEKAMQSGYIQQVIDGHTVWVKSNE